MGVEVLMEGTGSSKHSSTIQSSFSPLLNSLERGGRTYVVTSRQKADALNLQRVHNLLNVMNLYCKLVFKYPVVNMLRSCCS